jgi:DNA primase
MKFDDQFVEHVRNSVSIIDLVGGYIRLKKSGKDYSALCPFHQEKTPSFLVSEAKQIFKCFGCGAGGDVFKFVSLIENLSFPEAIRHLAERNGIALPAGRREHTAEAEDRRALLRLMEITCGFFQDCLRQQAPAGEAGHYLEARKINQDTAQLFGLGFAPGGNQLLNFLKKEGHSLADATQCGLLVENERGQLYDRFRNRLMFPIRDLSGRTIAFGGRILGEGVPKYLNSPETPLYHKSNQLYGLDVTRDAIRRADFAILVEGYFDLVVPFQAGYRNIVASLGTSLTVNQIRLLGRYTRNVAINFDPDNAGLSAAARSVELFLEQGFRVNVVCLPAGEDPDSFIRTQGEAAYGERLKSSRAYLDFLLDQLLRKHSNPSSPKAKQETVSGILPYLLKVTNRIERSEYVSLIAARLNLDEALLRSELRKIAPGKHGRRPELASLVKREISQAESNLLAAILDPEFRPAVLSQLEPDMVEGLIIQPIFEKVFELEQQNREISIINLQTVLSGSEDIHLLESVVLGPSQLPLSPEIVVSSIRALRKKQFERICRQIQDQIRIEEKQGAAKGIIAELVTRKEALRKKIELDLL